MVMESIKGMGPKKAVGWHKEAIRLWEGELKGRTASIAVRLGVSNKLIRRYLYEKGLLLEEDYETYSEGMNGAI